MLASGLSGYFVDKVNKVRDSIAASLMVATNITYNPPRTVSPQVKLSNFNPVSPIEVERLIRSAPCKKSPLDILPCSLFKQCGDLFSIPIAHLANLSLSNGLFPNSMKHGFITPFETTRP
jgi:hypothetical protein